MSGLDVNEAFKPNSALRTASRSQFVGREQSLSDVLVGISSEGAATCILGQRGVGKTSLAWRIQEYLSGDREWVDDRISLPLRVPDLDVVWLEVYRAHHNITGVVLDLLSNRGRSSRWSEVAVANEISSFVARRESPNAEQIANLLDSPLLRRFDQNLSEDEQNIVGTNSRSPISELSVEEQSEVLSVFAEAVDAVGKKRQREILFILDEIDRLPDKRGIGEFLKSGNFGIYCLVGVADSLEEIIVESVSTDHPSAERKLHPVLVEPLSEEEVRAFISTSNDRLYGAKLKFDEGFSKAAVRYCGGFPFILQRICRDAVLASFQTIKVKVTQPEGKQRKITEVDFFRALDGFLNPNVDGSGRYEKLSKGIDNANKEELLFRIAESGETWCITSEIEKEMSSKYGFAGNVIELATDEILSIGRLPDGSESLRFFDPKLRAIVLRVKDQNKRLFHKKAKRG
ncbi:MAG: ATP-binding protein [Pseudomonadota bacterium]